MPTPSDKSARIPITQLAVILHTRTGYTPYGGTEALREAARKGRFPARKDGFRNAWTVDAADLDRIAAAMGLVAPKPPRLAA